jgi:hypothetical protein
MKIYLKLSLRHLMTTLALALSGEAALAQTILPSDAYSSCAVSNKEFKGWFAPGSVSANAFVAPPRSLEFQLPARPCAFYKSAEHLFLWVTSPSPGGYRKGSYVFNSPVFYGVSPPDTSSQRTFIKNPADQIASVGISQLGPRGELVVFDTAGTMRRIVQVEGGINPFIRREGGPLVPIARVDVGRNGMPIFFDAKGDEISYERRPDETPKLLDIDRNEIYFALPPGNTIVANGQVFFLDRSGNAIAAAPGQAEQDHHVLMTPHNGLVYYLIQVNDVFAYFLTGTKNHLINRMEFPNTMKELNEVKWYAAKHGKPSFLDESALVVEIKSSWIEVRDESVNDYISIKASVPTFDMSTSPDTTWKYNKQQTVTLAMVGMHVAFSLKGFPGLIWATFEHVNNAPNAPYAYYDRDNKLKGGPWVFSSDGDATSNTSLMSNKPRMKVHGNDIVNLLGQTIGPSDVFRVSPWGSYPPEVERNTKFNTEILSINNSVRGQLAYGDLRKNYRLIGATWFFEFFPQGTLKLANSTMETFKQPSNCLDCHRGQGSDMLGSADGGVSHIYWQLKGLF